MMEVVLDNLLVVSNTFPAHDTNAGDWRIYTVCRELAKKHTVFFLPLAFLWEGRRYIDDLRKIGVHPLLPGAGRIFDLPRLLERHGIRTVVFEWYDTAEHFIPHFPRCPKVVIDTHELYFVKEARRLRVEGESAPRRYLRELREKELAVYRLADVLIAISGEERRILQKEFPRKKVIVMPTWGMPPVAAASRGFRRRKDLVFFASFRNREQVDGMAFFIGRVLPLVRKALPDVTLHVAGEGSFVLENTVVTERNREYVRIDGKVADIGEYLSRFRVFVCPLRYGAGQKKKILDAALSGCPVVATQFGAEGFDLRPGRDILFAESPASFARKIVSVYTDEQAWGGISRSALRRIKERHPYGQGFKELDAYVTA